MRQVLALLMVGAILTLATSAGLASAQAVNGLVTQKFTGGDGGGMIAVNGTPYEMPLDLYLTVQVGDTVDFDGTNWTIVGREAK